MPVNVLIVSPTCTGQRQREEGKEGRREGGKEGRREGEWEHRNKCRERRSIRPIDRGKGVRLRRTVSTKAETVSGAMSNRLMSTCVHGQCGSYSQQSCGHAVSHQGSAPIGFCHG